MYQLTHHCFGKVEILGEFDKYPTVKQIKAITPDALKKGDRWVERLLERQSLTLGVGEWLTIEGGENVL